jgi:hypothetical protein
LRPVKSRTQSGILIIHPEGNSFNNPTLKSLIDLFVSRGIPVDLRYGVSDAPMPAGYGGVKLLPYGKFHKFIRAIILENLCFIPLIGLVVALDNLLLYGSYRLVLGVDREGLIQAGLLHRMEKTPYVFLSFEIQFGDETSRRFKAPEIKASRDVAAWLVQDEVRARLLVDENKLDPDKKIMLPLASVGHAEPSSLKLRDRLGIPDEKKVAITMGSITAWSMAADIIKSATSWPEDWVLIVHDRYGKTSRRLHGILSVIEPYLNNKIYISDEASLMVDDLGNILAGVSAGLAFYRPVWNCQSSGKNIQYLGLASGKISTYLRYGIPVIVNEIGLYADEAQKHRFGLVVEDADRIGSRLDEIDRPSYRENAKRYFRECLDFKLHEEKILDCLKKNKVL